MNTTAKMSAVRTQGEETHAEPVKLLRRVGSTTVEVTVHFSKTSKETMADIVRRLLEREVDKVA
jgi:hypothetical protein